MRGLSLLFARLLQQLFIALVARFRFCLPCAWRSGNPFLLAGQRALARFLLAAFLFEPLLLLNEPGGIIALIGYAAAAIELENPAGNIVEEISIVGYDQNGAGIIAQMALEPRHRLGVEVIGRLVEEKELGLRQQELA